MGLSAGAALVCLKAPNVHRHENAIAIAHADFANPRLRCRAFTLVVFLMTSFPPSTTTTTAASTTAASTTAASARAATASTPHAGGAAAAARTCSAAVESPGASAEASGVA